MKQLHLCKRAGFTLVEVTISSLLFVILGVGITEAMRMANGTRQSVVSTTNRNQSMRKACNRLRDDWKFCNAGGAVITTLPDGNHEITFQQPIDVGGNPTWGIYEFSMGTDEASRTKEDWSICYTVRDVNVGNGVLERQLVRQLLDEAGTLQLEESLLSGLRDGAGAPPGFSVVQQGVMWEINLATEGTVGGSAGREAVFQARTLN